MWGSRRMYFPTGSKQPFPSARNGFIDGDRSRRLVLISLGLYILRFCWLKAAQILTESEHGEIRNNNVSNWFTFNIPQCLKSISKTDEKRKKTCWCVDFAIDGSNSFQSSFIKRKWQEPSQISFWILARHLIKVIIKDIFKVWIDILVAHSKQRATN